MEWLIEARDGCPKKSTNLKKISPWQQIKERGGRIRTLFILKLNFKKQKNFPNQCKKSSLKG